MPPTKNSIISKTKYECYATICKSTRKTLQSLPKLWMLETFKKTELQRGTKKDLMKDARGRNGKLQQRRHDSPPTMRLPTKEQRSADIISAS
jgi:hypothetical protein